MPRGEVGAEHQGSPGSRHPVGSGMRPPGWCGHSDPHREACGQSNLRARRRIADFHTEISPERLERVHVTRQLGFDLC